MGNLRSTLRFVVFIVAIMLFLVGGATWVIAADQDYSIAYEKVEDEVPPRASGEEWDVGAYETLDEQQRADFQRAVDGQVVIYETEDRVWSEVMEKDGRYYVFNTGGHFDWFDPATFGPVLASVSGLLATIWVARDEYRSY